MKDSYVLVRWPESQNFMECDWFRDEAILALGHEDKTGSSAYFIPEERILENSYIEQRVAELCRGYEISEESAASEWKKEPLYGGCPSLRQLVTEVALLVRKISSSED